MLHTTYGTVALSSGVQPSTVPCCWLRSGAGCCTGNFFRLSSIIMNCSPRFLMHPQHACCVCTLSQFGTQACGDASVRSRDRVSVNEQACASVLNTALRRVAIPVNTACIPCACMHTGCMHVASPVLPLKVNITASGIRLSHTWCHVRPWCQMLPAARWS